MQLFSSNTEKEALFGSPLLNLEITDQELEESSCIIVRSIIFRYYFTQTMEFVLNIMPSVFRLRNFKGAKLMMLKLCSCKIDGF